MPRGQKSKQHARKKRHQVGSDTQACGGAQEAAEAAEESTHFPQSLLDAELSSKIDMPPKSQWSSTTTLMPSFPESDEEFSVDSDESEESHSDDQHSTTNPHEDLVARKMLELVQVLLHNFSLKQLSTKTEMMNVVSRAYEKHFPEILRKASKTLDEAFAVEVREVDSSPSTYNLFSKLKLPNNGRIRAGRGFPKTGFLMCVLGIIFVRGNCAREEEIWKILKKKRIYPGKKHSIFGEPRKLMTQDLVKLKYLEYRQVANSHPPRYELLWGPQAHVDTSKMQVLQFLAKMNKISPSSLLLLYEEAIKDDEVQAQSRDAANPDTADQASETSMAICPAASHTSFYI